MTDALYMHYYRIVGSEVSTVLHENVCPALQQAVESGLTVPAFAMPSLNIALQDLIHALVVTNAYHPKNFKNYGVLKYFLVCLVATGPSSTLRSIFTGDRWSFTASPTAIPALLIAMLISLTFGGFPQPLSTLLQLLNNMSSVMSVQAGMRKLHADASITPMASWLLGIANGAGGLVWSILITAWFGNEGQQGHYRWDRAHAALPSWILLSTVWNLYFWSNCPHDPQVTTHIEYSLFFMLVINGILTLLRSRAAPAPPSQQDPPSSNKGGDKVKKE